MIGLSGMAMCSIALSMPGGTENEGNGIRYSNVFSPAAKWAPADRGAILNVMLIACISRTADTLGCFSKPPGSACQYNSNILDH
jgi:hypothetical protein